MPITSALNAADLQPHFASPGFQSTAELVPRSFSSLQLRLKSSIKALLKLDCQRILSVCGGGTDMMRLCHDLLVQAGADKVSCAYAPSRQELTGAKGLIAGGGVIIMPIARLNDHAKWLDFVDEAMARHPKTKLVLYGDAGDCAYLGSIWPALAQAVQTDVVLEFPAQQGLNLIGSLLAGLKPKLQCDFDASAVQTLAAWSCRLSGDQRWLGLPERAFYALCAEAASFAKDGMVRDRQIIKAIAAKDFRENFIAESEMREHRDRQLLIATRGLNVGQINGLSVIETASTAYEFGEPVRITAALRAGGDGDVSDIERKAELAGQIHAKAMMIINGFISREFGSEQPLPVTPSLVFEQSYSEIDGDSASLTGLCAVLSCMGNVPLRQDLAVTGAVDQFGDVQPVGGVNLKIEGFYKVCRLHGLTGSQGVIIPTACVRQLALRSSVVNAVKAGKFHIYPVDHVSQAMEILSGTAWGSVKNNEGLAGAIAARLFEIGAHYDHPWWRFWERWL